MKTIQELLGLSEKVHNLAVISTNIKDWGNFDRFQKQEKFREIAIKLNVANKTKDMEFVVTKCLSMSGYGS